MDARPPTPLELLLADVDSFGRIVRRRRLRDHGHSPHLIASAVAAGHLTAAGRLWVAEPKADARLVNAARLGVVLSCVTAARHLGLWTIDVPHAHIGAGPHASRLSVQPGTVVHWGRPLVARNPDALIDPIENVLAFTALCLPREQAQVIWESALQKRLVDPVVLGRMPLSGAARTLLQSASHVADSGLETIFRTRLRWLKLRILTQIWVYGHRVDFLIGERLVVQIDGGHHVDAQREEDNRHDAALLLRGYHVIRVGYRQVMDDWPGVQKQILDAIAQGLHLAA